MLMRTVARHVDDGAAWKNLTSVPRHRPPVYTSSQLYVGDYPLNLDLCVIESFEGCFTCCDMPDCKPTVFKGLLEIKGNQCLIFC